MPQREMCLWYNEDWKRDDIVYTKQVTDEYTEAVSCVRVDGGGKAPKIKTLK